MPNPVTLHTTLSPVAISLHTALLTTTRYMYMIQPPGAHGSKVTKHDAISSRRHPLPFPNKLQTQSHAALSESCNKTKQTPPLPTTPTLLPSWPMSAKTPPTPYLHPLSVVELTAPTPAHRIQILVALDRPTLHRLHRSWPSLTVPLRPLATSTRRSKTSAIDTGPTAPISRLSVIRPSPVVEAMSTPSHRPSPIIVSTRRVPRPAHGRVEHAAHVHPVLHAVSYHGHAHVGQVEAARCSRRLHMVAHGEVPVAIGITARRCNVRRVKYVAVDKTQLSLVSKFLLPTPSQYSHLSAAAPATRGGASQYACAKNARP